MIVPSRITSRGNVVPAFQIDDEFAEQVLAHKWTVISNGHLQACIDGRFMQLHRFVWTLKHGSCPPMLDHIHGDKMDNRIENLRPADWELNNINARHCRHKHDLPPGVHGPHPLNRNRPFCARIRRGGRNLSLGYFATPEEASAAYEAARSQFIAERAEHCRKQYESKANPPKENADDQAA